MKSLYGKLNKLCAALIAASMVFINTTVLASENKIEFILDSINCGSEVVQATSGSGQLSASADGVNKEEIRWDTDETILAPRMQGKKLATGWGLGGYWMLNFSAKRLKNLKLSADMFSSGKGPRDFEVYYSTDGVEFTKIDESNISLTENSGAVYNNFSLPSALDGQADVYIKIMISSEMSVKGKSITGVKDGSTYINNIIISADDNAGGGGKDEDKDDDNKTDSDNEKQYYTVGKNIETSRMGRPTGKYKFSVKIFN